jgi:hypothetical protein
MKKKIDQLINESGLGGEYSSGWYGFKVTCDLHTHGSSNMSAPSTQEYCNRIPKKKRVVKSFNGKLCYEKGKPRPTYDPLRCSWQVCPKLKNVLKKNMEE